MALQVASLFATLGLRDELTPGLQKADGEMRGFSSQMRGALSNVGSSLSDLGGKMTALSAPLAGVFAIGIKSAMDFDSTMTNIQTVTGKSAGEVAKLKGELLAVGAETRAGPQAVAEAYYDVAGGVADASTHMAVLKAAIQTAEAGQADLGVTTSGLISVMNAYKLSADDAGYASDVFTRTVGVGVGSMDEFVSAMSPLAGLMAQTDQDFDDVGAMMAFMTTKGTSAAQSATRLQAATTALLNPNAELTKLLKKIGVESGSALIQQYGLAGALSQLKAAAGGSTDAMAKALGSVEALGAASLLTGDDFAQFSQNFQDGLLNATGAAQQVQMGSAAAQFDLLKSKAGVLLITLGEALLPVFHKIVDAITPIIDKIVKWVQENPELVSTIAQIGMAAVVAGPALMGLGSIFRMASGGVSALLSPMGLLLGLLAIAGPESIGVALQKAGDGVGSLAEGIGKAVSGDLSGGLESIGTGLKGIAEGALQIPLDISKKVGDAIGVDVEGGLQAWEGVFANVKLIADTIGLKIGEGLNSIKTEAERVFNGVKSVVEPIWSSIFGEEGFISGLAKGAGTLISTALTGIQSFVQDPFGTLKNTVSTIWSSIFGEQGFIQTAIPTAFNAVSTAIENSPLAGALNTIKGVIEGIWNGIFGDNSFFRGVVGLAINNVRDAISNSPIVGALNTIKGVIEGIWNGIFGVPDGVLPRAVQTAVGFIQGILNGITTAIQGIKDGIQGILGGGLKDTADKQGGVVMNQSNGGKYAGKTMMDAAVDMYGASGYSPEYWAKASAAMTAGKFEDKTIRTTVIGAELSAADKQKVEEEMKRLQTVLQEMGRINLQFDPTIHNTIIDTRTGVDETRQSVNELAKSVGTESVLSTNINATLGAGGVAATALTETNARVDETSTKVADIGPAAANGFAGLTPKMVAPFASWLKMIGNMLVKTGVTSVVGIGQTLIAAAGMADTGGGGGVAYKAEGGWLTTGQPTWVGERGPELIVPRRGDYVVPNHALGGGGGAIHIGVINLNGVDDFGAILDGVQDEARRRGRRVMY